MATGGQWAQSVSAQHVLIAGRVSSSGGVNAPAIGPKFTVTYTATGIYSIVFSQQYAEFLGCVVTCEGTAGTGNFAQVTSFTPSTKTLIVETYSATSTPAAVAFAFLASFTESRAP